MKSVSNLLLTATFLAAISACALADDLEKLAGKWTVNKTSEDGRKYSQALEIKKDKLTFKILDESKEVRLYAEGTVKVEKLGPFSVMKVIDIKAGQSESNVQPIDDERVNIYQLGYDTLTMASNFDKERDQKPVLDVYKKADK